MACFLVASDTRLAPVWPQDEGEFADTFKLDAKYVISSTREKGSDMTDPHERAAAPEDIARLFVERANARDADGLAALYAPDAVLAYPPGKTTQGRDAILAVYQQMVELGLQFTPEKSLPTLRHGDLALTSTFRKDGNGVRIQVARQQADGSWLRIIDWPEMPESPE